MYVERQKKIVKEMKFYFSVLALSRNQNTPNKSLTIKKDI